VNFLYDDIVHALQNTIDSFFARFRHRSTRLAAHPMYRNTSLSNSVKQRNVTAITPFEVIQGHRFRYQSKAHIRLPISD